MTIRRFAFIAALGAFLAAPVAALAAGGTIVKLDGNASVERGGQRIPISESFALYTGDVLNVASGSNAQLRFEDDSIFVVPGPAKFRVDEFTMPGASGGGKALYTLVDGGLRTITGKVKGGQGQYELRTDEGTITVDGSAYFATRCTGACARRHPGGFYVKCESGIITVTGSGGAIKLKPGQIAFIPTGGGAAQLVRLSPFTDPDTASSYGATVEFGTDVHPPRIERETSVSPS